ncbi:MAG: SDR family NAD(P)-dependent oxidoreductase [Deltaproteobacteria bacterium]|nr:SDR family NAD(P)-dependent oxidoreductase [Deltaproteobacteria bacterium]
MKKAVLITGGAGFLGSHLCDHYIKHGCQVICLDNLSSAPKHNIEHLLDHTDFVFIEHDVTMQIEIPQKVDSILHFASPASPAIMKNNPVETAKASTLGTYYALELARTSRAKFMLASSDAVYGDPEEHPQKESCFGHVNPVGQRSCYDEAKRFAEAFTMAYHRQYRVNTAIARIFHSYGERLFNDGRLIPVLIERALSGEPITILGDGCQTRSFCYISDLIDGIARLSDSSIHSPVNLGNPREISVLDLARLIIDLTGSSSRIEFRDALQADRRSRKPDISLARSRLNWLPVVDLEEGLQRTIDFMREHSRHSAVEGKGEDE